MEKIKNFDKITLGGLMKIDIIERGGYNAAQRLKKIIIEKLEKLDKYFVDDVSAKVVCLKQDKQERLEITIKSKGFLYRSEVSSDNMYDNIDIALPKLEKQIVRESEKRKDKNKSRGVKEMVTLPFEYLEELPEELPSIYKRKVFDLDPMLIDDARYAIERVGHDFYAFLNAETGKINVLYRRRDGKFGLIELNY